MTSWLSRGRRSWFAWLLSGLVLVLLGISALPGVRAEPPVYDAIVTLTSLTVIGLIWTAYFAGRTLQYQQRHDADVAASRRRALAQAMDVELTRLEGDVAMIQETGVALMGEHPLLNRAMETPEVFQLQTVRSLAGAIHELDELRAVLLLSLADKAKTGPYISTESGVSREPPYARTERLVKGRASLTAVALRDLRTEVQNEMTPVPEIRPTPSDVLPAQPRSESRELPE